MAETSSPCNLDEAESLQNFILAMNIHRGSATNPSVTEPVTGDLESEQVNVTENASDGTKETSKTPTVGTPPSSRSRVSSESLQVTPSPDIRGLQPPQNTPLSVPHSPILGSHASSLSSKDDLLQQVLEMSSGFNGKSLSGSMWASKTHLPSHLRSQQPSTGILTPTKIVEHDDSIHQDYARMSFKAADPEHKGASLVGDKVPINPFSRSPSQQALAEKLETLKAQRTPDIQVNDFSGDSASPSLTEKENVPFGSPVKAESSGFNLSLSPRDSQPSDESPTKFGRRIHLASGGVPLVPDDWEPMAPTTAQSAWNPTESTPKATAKNFLGVAEGSSSKKENLPPHLRSKPKQSKTHEAEGSSKAGPPDTEIEQPDTEIGSLTPKAPAATQNLPESPKAFQATPGEPVSPIKEPFSALSSSEFLSQWLSSKKPSATLSKSDQIKDEKKTEEAKAQKGSTGFETSQVSASDEHLKETVEASWSTKEVEGTTSLSPGETTKVEDLEEKLFFKSWPKSGARAAPAACVRTVIIASLPSDATETFVTSLVFGGPLEKIDVQPSLSAASESSTAYIRFLDLSHCQKFYDATSNGLVYGHDSAGEERIAWVTLSSDVDVVGGLLSQWIIAGFTRCVRAVPVDDSITTDQLRKIAERKARKVEAVEDGQTITGMSRFVIWRFCNISHAVEFKAALSRDEEWEACNITFADDPCAK